MNTNTATAEEIAIREDIAIREEARKRLDIEYLDVLSERLQAIAGKLDAAAIDIDEGKPFPITSGELELYSWALTSIAAELTGAL